MKDVCSTGTKRRTSYALKNRIYRPQLCVVVCVQLVEVCKRHEFTDVVILQETRGEPDAMIVSHLPYGPTAYFSMTNCVLRHDIENRVRIIRLSFSFPLSVFIVFAC